MMEIKNAPRLKSPVLTSGSVPVREFHKIYSGGNTMKKCIARIALTATSLLLAATMAFAIEAKTPDAKGIAKTSADSPKTTVDKNKADTKAARTAPSAKIIDVNSATEAELKAIPGIGDAYAAKIVAGRPYANKTQLKSRNILPVPVYEKTKDMIIAKQPKK
jgi:DNA uptake protein ComE-like DNA-binding protein